MLWAVCRRFGASASKWGSKGSKDANEPKEAKDESKRGQIKIQDDHRFGARNTITKFCPDPFCAVSGASALSIVTVLPRARWSPAKSHPQRPRPSRQSVCHGHAPRMPYPSGEHVQYSNWGLVWYWPSCVPNFPCFRLKRPDWGAYPWHTLWREYRGFGSLRVTANEANRAFACCRDVRAWWIACIHDYSLKRSTPSNKISGVHRITMDFALL